MKDSGGSTISSYQYDGLGRRISEATSGTTTDLYVSTADQVLEERVSGTATAQYVWSPVYVDAMVLRDRDSDANGSLDERRWVQQDANWNVTALLDNSGAVVERYAGVAPVSVHGRIVAGTAVNELALISRRLESIASLDNVIRIIAKDEDEWADGDRRPERIDAAS